MSTSNRKIITQENPQSYVSEAYRVLRTNLRYANAGEQLKAIVITSAERGEGKTVTTMNLAVALAQEGKKVVVVDADMREPSLHHFLNKSNRVGLSNVLNGTTSLRQALVDTSIDKLELLPSGPKPFNPAELLASDRMCQVLDELKAEYDMVLIDTPPTLAVTDSQVLAVRSDGVLFIVGSGSVKRGEAERAVARLRQVQAKLLGAVLNRSRNVRAVSPY